jgi:mRNA interferase MazF
VFEVDVPDIGRKLWLVVSNNPRNRNLDDVLVVRLTTSPKPTMPSYVELTRTDAPFVGRVVCDDLGPLRRSDLGRPRGALSPTTMRRVNDGLRSALALD